MQSNNVGFAYFNSLANTSLAIQGNLPNKTSAPVGPLPRQAIDFLEQNLDTYALNRSTGSSINVRDNILRDRVEDGLPAQFIYEPTDCRLFYTPLSIVDPVEQWRQVAEAAWGSGSCVAGSLETGTGNSLRRTVLTAEQRRRGLETGTVVSIPDKTPSERSVWWTANHDMSVPF